MWNGFEGPDGWGWLWMSAMMLLFWAPLLFALVWAIRQFGPVGSDPGRWRGEAEQDAVQIARSAYARGDMSRERYLQVIEDLEREPQRSKVAAER